jgi:hypothetical protein
MSTAIERKLLNQLMLLHGQSLYIGENINTTKKRTGDASKEVGLEVNTEKTKYMFMSHYHNA